MFKLTRSNVENFEYQVQKGIQFLDDHLSDSPDVQKEKIKALNQKVRVKSAKKIGLNPNEPLANYIRTILNEKIILEVNTKKLKHREVAAIIQSSRPNVTAIMNRRIKTFSTDVLIRILSMLGISVHISFIKD